jgi:hypothetical protein
MLVEVGSQRASRDPGPRGLRSWLGMICCVLVTFSLAYDTMAMAEGGAIPGKVGKGERWVCRAGEMMLCWMVVVVVLEKIGGTVSQATGRKCDVQVEYMRKAYTPRRTARLDDKCE